MCADDVGSSGSGAVNVVDKLSKERMLSSEGQGKQCVQRLVLLTILKQTQSL